MTKLDGPVLHRDDPEKAPLVGHIKVTSQDWLNIARDVLVTEGVGEVKILSLASRMGVSRSSFYWYFKNRSDLLDALLQEWEDRNTAQIIAHCEKPAATISHAVCNFFRCFVVPHNFDQGLDFAIREWSRRDETLRARIDAADATRIASIGAMFARFGYSSEDADARARILYFMQLGYHALKVREDTETRLSRLASYLVGFTGQDADPGALDQFTAEIRKLNLG